MNGITKECLRKELECGKRLKDLFEFSDGQDCIIYKGKFDLNNAENIIYIPDIFLNDIDIDTDFLTEMEIKNALNNCYTTNDFLEEAQGHVNLAESLFDYVDWQHLDLNDLLEGYKDEQEEFLDRYGFSYSELETCGENKKITNINEVNAKIFCDAIRTITEKPENIDILESYLTQHFAKWLNEYANNPEGLAMEMKSFAEMEL